MRTTLLAKLTTKNSVCYLKDTEKNKKVIKEKIPQLQKEIEELKLITVNVEKFISIAKKYTVLQELTPEILRTFISKIIIHERAQKWKKTSEQQIDIYFQYIGSIPETPIEKAG